MKKRFIFDENYIKKYAKKDKTKWLIGGIGLLALILILIIVILATRKPKKPDENKTKPSFELKEELVVQAGDRLPEIADYFKKLENIDIDSIKISYPEDFEISYDTSSCSDEDNEKMNAGANIEDFNCVEKSLKTTATYGVSLVILNQEYTVRLIVTDTMPPILSLKPLEIYAGNSYNIDDFISFCVDGTGSCEFAYYDKDIDQDGNVIDYSKFTEPGTYKIRIYAKDDYENISDPYDTELKILASESTMYTITFNANGGSAVDSIKVPEGSVITEPKTPVRDGYTFSGWYNGNSKFDFSTKIDKDITLTARWNKNGSTNPPGPVNPGTITVKSVSLNFKKINLYVGDSKTVTASIYPSNANDKNVVWTSADSSIASVANGKITGLKVGTTTVTATVGGKSASVEVAVRDKASSTCSFGDINYNTQFVLSVNLIKNNCAVDPNGAYNEVNSVAAREIRKATSELTSMGFTINDISVKDSDYKRIKNNAGTGLVGVQITMTIKAVDSQNPYVAMTAEYIIKPDGSRQFVKNNIQKNGVSFK